MKRLADHFEAYIYALYLDQGIDALGRFLGPIFVHSLYKGGQHFGFTLNKKEKVVSLEKEGRACKFSFLVVEAILHLLCCHVRYSTHREQLFPVSELTFKRPSFLPHLHQPN